MTSLSRNPSRVLQGAFILHKIRDIEQRRKMILAIPRFGLLRPKTKLPTITTTDNDIDRSSSNNTHRMQHEPFAMEASPLRSWSELCFPHVSFVGLTGRNALPLHGRRTHHFWSNLPLILLPAGHFPPHSGRSTSMSSDNTHFPPLIHKPPLHLWRYPGEEQHCSLP